VYFSDEYIILDYRVWIRKWTA